jgi:hypothetical protein
MGDLGKYALPRNGTSEYSKKIERLKKFVANNPEVDKKFNEYFERAINTVNTQRENGANLPADNELRYFLEDYNSRNFKYGLRSMPVSFNILEAFFDFDPELQFFRLLPEEDHNFSVFHFIDFITSPKFSEDKELIKGTIVENLIHNYNIISPLGEITFTTEDGKEYVIGAASLVRRGDEVCVFLLTGQKADTIEETKKILSEPQNFTFTKGKERMQLDPDLRREAVKLFNRSEYWKTLAFCRIDIDRMTVDARTIQIDKGNVFDVFTDDISGFLGPDGQLASQYEDIFQRASERILLYSPIFEVATKFLYLPHYFNHFEENIIQEEHPTKLASKRVLRNAYKSSSSVDPEFNIKSKTVFTLDFQPLKKADYTYFGDNQFKIEKSGYWKHLEYTSIGKDKTGNEIHGKTWVDQTLSWYEENRQTLIAQFSHQMPPKPGSNPGYIYLMRNASHEIDIFKIGLTRLDPKIRAKQLSSTTSSPDKFLVANEWETTDCILAEKLIHDQLRNYRLNDSREFFKVPYNIAIDTINQIIKAVDES